jgi:hypothetical protein
VKTLAPVLVVVAIAGCGGGDPGPKLTKAEFIAKGDKLCSDFRAHTPAGVKWKNWGELHRGTAAAADAEARFRASFDDLNAPADGRAVHDHVVDDVDRSVDIMRKISDIAAKPNASWHAALSGYVAQLRSLGDQMHAEMGAYGFKVCSQPRSV